MNNLYLQRLKALNMDILEVDEIVLDDRWAADNVISPFTRIYMVTKGTGYLRFKTEDVTMTPGNIYIIPAGTKFSFRCEDGFSKIYFHITMLKPDGYDILENTREYFHFSDPKTVTRAKTVFPIDSVAKVIDCKTNLYYLISKCISELEDLNINTYSELVQNVIKYIDRNLSSKLSAEMIAEAFFISLPKLRKIFREETGISMGKYIHNSIIRVSEEYVRNSTLSIHEISDKLGFCDQFYFSRCFVQKYGMSPQQYRKVHQTKAFNIQ